MFSTSPASAANRAWGFTPSGSRTWRDGTRTPSAQLWRRRLLPPSWHPPKPPCAARAPTFVAQLDVEQAVDAVDGVLANAGQGVRAARGEERDQDAEVVEGDDGLRGRRTRATLARRARGRERSVSLPPRRPPSRPPTGGDVHASPSKAGSSSSEEDVRALPLLTLTFSLLR